MEISGKMHEGDSPVVSPKSLDELPINVIFQILSELKFSDLKNVSATCWTLRILTNEKLMYYSILHDPKNQYLWTKRYFLDSLRMLQRNRRGFDFVSLNDTTFFQSLRYLHNGVRKVSGNLLRLLESNDNLGINEIDTATEGEDNDNMNNNENDNESNGYDSQNQRVGKKYINDGRTDGEMMPDNSDLWETEDESDIDTTDDINGLDQIYAENISVFEEDTGSDSYNDGQIQPVQISMNDFADSESTPTKKPCAKPTKIDKEGLKYLRVLEGFHRIGVISGRETPDRVITHNTSATPNKYGNLLDDVQFTPLSTISSLLKRIDSGSDSNHAHSPDSFGILHSRSGSSVFSDGAPKLADQPWSKIYELDHQSLSSSDSDSSSSTEFIRQLQSSKKVKDKAVLFERLLAKSKERSVSLKEKKFHASSNNGNCRKVSDDYLAETRRNASPAPSSVSSIDTEMRLTIQEAKNNSNDHFDSHAKTKSSSTHGTKHSKIHHRKKLKALVMDGNRICYEKITE
ncbi:Mfb1 [Kluyveromyces lactis]|nr:Mfb1 [Kluyveromyces lactis]